MNNQTNTEIGAGSVVNANVGELENITREGRSRRTRKYAVGCVEIVMGKKKFIFQFEDGQKKEISSSLLVILSSKEEVDRDETTSDSPKKEQGKLLNIVGDTEVGEPCMFGKGMYLSVFYCFFYEMYTVYYLYSRDFITAVYI